MHHICTLYGVGNLRRKQRNVSEKRGFGGGKVPLTSFAR